jgi:hypothetical protein
VKKRESRELSKHTLNLFAGQVDKLQELFPRLGAAKVIRTLVDDYLRSHAERTARQLDPIPESQVPLEEIL